MEASGSRSVSLRSYAIPSGFQHCLNEYLRILEGSFLLRSPYRHLFPNPGKVSHIPLFVHNSSLCVIFDRSTYFYSGGPRPSFVSAFASAWLVYCGSYLTIAELHALSVFVTPFHSRNVSLMRLSEELFSLSSCFSGRNCPFDFCGLRFSPTIR